MTAGGCEIAALSANGLALGLALGRGHGGSARDEHENDMMKPIRQTLNY